MVRATSPSVLVAFGLAVRKLRLAKGWSQEKLAEFAGIHRTYVGDVERGGRNVSLVNIERLARALKIGLPGLMTEVEVELLATGATRARRRS
jgi:transcriptional regulator with XRE-family HTH domain